jgi:hypothetical protein
LLFSHGVAKMRHPKERGCVINNILMAAWSAVDAISPFKLKAPLAPPSGLLFFGRAPVMSGVETCWNISHFCSRIASRENHLPRLVRPSAFPCPPGGLSAPGRPFMPPPLVVRASPSGRDTSEAWDSRPRSIPVERRRLESAWSLAEVEVPFRNNRDHVASYDRVLLELPEAKHVWCDGGLDFMKFTTTEKTSLMFSESQTLPQRRRANVKICVGTGTVLAPHSRAAAVRERHACIGCSPIIAKTSGRWTCRLCESDAVSASRARWRTSASRP